MQQVGLKRMSNKLEKCWGARKVERMEGGPSKELTPSPRGQRPLKEHCGRPDKFFGQVVVYL